MVAHLLRLRLDLLVGTLRARDRARRIAAFCAAVAATVLVCMFVLALREESAVVAGAVMTLGASALFLGAVVLPVVAGARDPLDPRRFRVFGVEPHRMPVRIAVASLVSVPGVAVIAVAACTGVLAAFHGAPGTAAIVLPAAGAASILLAGRIGLAISAVLPQRRPRELTVVLLLIAVVVCVPVAIFFAAESWNQRIPDSVSAATVALGFTPIAPAVASVFGFASGGTFVAWTSAVISVVTLGALWALWSWSVRAALTQTDAPRHAGGDAGLGWFWLVPPGAFGAIAARSLIYWTRDRRYLVNIAVVPVAALLAVLPLLVAGVPDRVIAVIPVLIMALLFGWLPHNDIAYDASAFWIHVASGVGGLSDRLGRIMPILLIGVPLLAVALPVTLFVTGEWRLLPALSGAVICLFLSGLGLSSIVSASAPYAVPRPGDSPFRQPQRSDGRGAFGHAVALLGAFVFSAPTLWLFVIDLIDGGGGMAAFWLGVSTGVGIALLGLAIGSFVYTARGERLMEFVETL